MLRGADSEEITGKKVHCGDLGIVSDTGARHLTFSSERVRKPMFGEVYAGIGREGEWLFMFMVSDDKMKKKMKLGNHIYFAWNI